MLLTTKEVCEKYRVRRETVRIWRNKYGMPYHQYGEKTFRYVEEDIEEWSRKNFKNGRYSKFTKE